MIYFLGGKMIHSLESELVICFARWTGVDMQPLHTLNALQSLSTKAALPVGALQMCEYKYKDSSVFVMMEARCLLPPSALQIFKYKDCPVFVLTQRQGGGRDSYHHCNSMMSTMGTRLNENKSYTAASLPSIQTRIPDVCQFRYTTTLLRHVKSTLKSA